jgi:hypothetical protein
MDGLGMISFLPYKGLGDQTPIVSQVDVGTDNTAHHCLRAYGRLPDCKRTTCKYTSVFILKGLFENFVSVSTSSTTGLASRM